MFYPEDYTELYRGLFEEGGRVEDSFMKKLRGLEVFESGQERELGWLRELPGSMARVVGYLFRLSCLVSETATSVDNGQAYRRIEGFLK